MTQPSPPPRHLPLPAILNNIDNFTRRAFYSTPPPPIHPPVKLGTKEEYQQLDETAQQECH